MSIVGIFESDLKPVHKRDERHFTCILYPPVSKGATYRIRQIQHLTYKLFCKKVNKKLLLAGIIPAPLFVTRREAGRKKWVFSTWQKFTLRSCQLLYSLTSFAALR